MRRDLVNILEDPLITSSPHKLTTPEPIAARSLLRSWEVFAKMDRSLKIFATSKPHLHRCLGPPGAPARPSDAFTCCEPPGFASFTSSGSTFSRSLGISSRPRAMTPRWSTVTKQICKE